VSSVVALLVTWRLWPARWRPRGAVRTTLAALLGAYLAVSLGGHAGFNAWLDEDIIDKSTKAEIDGTDVWVIAPVVALTVLGADQLRRRSR